MQLVEPQSSELDAFKLERLAVQWHQDKERVQRVAELESGVELWCVSWPPKVRERSRVFIVDGKTSHPIGFAILLHESSDVLTMSNIFLEKSWRGQGVGLAVYLVILRSGYAVMSDIEHTPDSAALWKRLSSLDYIDVNFLDRRGEGVAQSSSAASELYDMAVRLIAKIR